MTLVSNDTVIGWIAPIITTPIAGFIVYIVNIIRKRSKSISVIKTINVANKRLMDSIRPFFIQGIKLEKDILLNIRNAIAREYGIEIKSMFSINQIKENIILDVSETRFLKDQDKIKLIDFIESVFKEYIPDGDNEREQSLIRLMQERENISRYNNILILSSVMISLSVALLTVTVDKTTNNIEFNFLDIKKQSCINLFNYNIINILYISLF
jgi:hypothetical protein